MSTATLDDGRNGDLNFNILASILIAAMVLAVVAKAYATAFVSAPVVGIPLWMQSGWSIVGLSGVAFVLLVVGYVVANADSSSDADPEMWFGVLLVMSFLTLVVSGIWMLCYLIFG